MFIKQMPRRCFYTKPDMNLALLQIRSTIREPGLPTSAMLLINCLVRGIMLRFSRSPINVDDDNHHHASLLARPHKADKKYDTLRD